MKSKKINYYKDELNDEFSGAKITPRIIDEKYKYIHKNPLWNFASLLLQNVLSMPIKILYGKIKFIPTPEGEDPSSVFQKFGKKGVIECLKNAKQIEEIYLG